MLALAKLALRPGTVSFIAGTHFFSFVRCFAALLRLTKFRFVSSFPLFHFFLNFLLALRQFAVRQARHDRDCHDEALADRAARIPHDRPSERSVGLFPRLISFRWLFSTSAQADVSRKSLVAIEI